MQTDFLETFVSEALGVYKMKERAFKKLEN